jgi:ABC-type nitrate/sulfonate/bicarbonate transport system permease component
MKIREELPPLRRRFIGLVSAALFLLSWFAVTLPVLPNEAGPQPLVPGTILPAPAQVLAAMSYLHYEEALVRSALASFLRISVAFTLTVCVAIPLGVLMGTYAPIRAWFEPFTNPLRYLPISAVTGLFMLLFGFGENMKIMFLFVGSVVYLLPLVAEAIAAVDEVYLETAYTLGARPWQVVLRVLLPGALPSIFEGCRVIYGVGWTYVILAEIVNAEYGLGHLIIAAQKRGNYDQSYALVIIVLLLGVATNEIFRLSGRRLFAWRQV